MSYSDSAVSRVRGKIFPRERPDFVVRIARWHVADRSGLKTYGERVTVSVPWLAFAPRQPRGETDGRRGLARLGEQRAHADALLRDAINLAARIR